MLELDPQTSVPIGSSVLGEHVKLPLPLHKIVLCDVAQRTSRVAALGSGPGQNPGATVTEPACVLAMHKPDEASHKFDASWQPEPSA